MQSSPSNQMPGTPLPSLSSCYKDSPTSIPPMGLYISILLYYQADFDNSPPKFLPIKRLIKNEYILATKGV